MSRRFHTTAAGHRNNAASDTLRSTSTFYGQIHRTKNKSQPPIRRATLWTFEISRAQKLSAGDARTERRATQTVRLRDRARRETETSLSVRSARATIPSDFPKRVAQTGR